MTAPTVDAEYCEECQEMECVWCRDFTAPTAAEVDAHARSCPEQRAAAMDRAVQQLNEDMTIVEATKEDNLRGQLRAQAEHNYLNAVTGGSGS